MCTICCHIPIFNFLKYSLFSLILTKNKIFLTDLATVRTGVIFFGVLKGFSDMKGFSDLKGFLYQSQYLKGNMKTIFERGLGNGFVVNRDQERSLKAFLIPYCQQAVGVTTLTHEKSHFVASCLH